MTDSSAAPEATCVLVNAEEQYCLWPTGKEIPGGWSLVFQGDRDSCLEYVERVWTDMRPKSLRDAIEREAAEADGRGR